VKSEDEDTYGGPVVMCSGDIRLVKFNIFGLKPKVLEQVPVYLANSNANLTNIEEFSHQVLYQSVQYLG
jgi:hypothetical protein